MFYALSHRARLCDPCHYNISDMPALFLNSFRAADVHVLVDFIDGIQVDYGSNFRLDGLISFEVNKSVQYRRYRSKAFGIDAMIQQLRERNTAQPDVMGTSTQ